MYKEHNLVLLPTDKPSSIFKTDDDILYYGLNTTNVGRKSFELYVLSDKPIQELPK